MVNVKSKNCGEAGCSKLVQYGVDGIEKEKFCCQHVAQEMTNVPGVPERAQERDASNHGLAERGVGGVGDGRRIKRSRLAGAGSGAISDGAGSRRSVRAGGGRGGTTPPLVLEQPSSGPMRCLKRKRQT